MPFVPNTHRKQALIVNRCVFAKGKDSKGQSIGDVKFHAKSAKRVVKIVFKDTIEGVN